MNKSSIIDFISKKQISEMSLIRCQETSESGKISCWNNTLTIGIIQKFLINFHFSQSNSCTAFKHLVYNVITFK